MTTIHSKRWPWVALGFLLFLLVGGVALLPAGPAAATPLLSQPGFITGMVSDPDGHPPPPQTRVYLTAPDGIVRGQTAVDPATGAFTLGPVANGYYVLQARPPAGSSYTPSLPRPVMVAGGPVDAGTLALTTPAITGTVYAPDGTTPVTALVHVARAGHHVQSTLAPSGTIRLGGLFTGTYALWAAPVGNVPYWQSPRAAVTITHDASQTVDLQLRPANVAGQVTDPVGAPVRGATVHVLGSVHHVHRQDRSGVGGYFAIGDLPPDTYVLRVEPPQPTNGLAPSEAVTFTVPPAFTDVGAVPLRAAPKVLHGQVKTNTGVPVQNARVIAHRLNYPGRATTLTGADGRYELRLDGGLWSVRVEPTSASDPPHWLYQEPPQLVHFARNHRPEVKTLDFRVLTADSHVVGVVTLPDGSVPPFTVTVGLRNGEGRGHSVTADPQDGSFDLNVPHGNYRLFVQPHDPAYAGPPPLAVYAPVSDTLDVGTLALLARDAVISGTVADTDGNGVQGVRIVAWARGYRGAQTRTGPDGTYALAVPAGEWLVMPRVPPQMPYLYSGEPVSVAVASGQTASDVDFTLAAADNVVAGQLVDPEGHLVLAEGWAAASSGDRPVNGAPISRGHFTLYLPDGSFDVGVYLAPGSEWLAGPPQPVSVACGETVTLTFPLQPQDATIVGALWDRRQEIVPTGVSGRVVAHNPWATVVDAIDPANGTYHLGVSAGLWHLGYRVDPSSGYVPLDHHKVIPIESGQTLAVPLPVVQRDSVLQGIVVDPFGNPLPGAVVAADGRGRDVGQVTLRTTSDDQGHFRLPVPHGVYNVRAAAGRPAWLNPVLHALVVPPHSTVGNLVLPFREPDATLSGTTSLAGSGPADGRVHIWAYSDDGAATHTTAPLGDTYELGLSSGATWHVGAALETSHAFYAVRETIVVTGDVTLDLVLQGPFPKPGPVSASFDATQAQHLALADGTQIFIPAGAMPVSGTVTLHVTPIATLPHQHHARLYKYGYAFVATDESGRPITARFNQDVIVNFSYDEAELHALGLREERLKPAYFSTSTQSWTIPDGYVVDTDANRVTMQIDHFTDFSLLNGAAMYEVFLPLIDR